MGVSCTGERYGNISATPACGNAASQLVSPSMLRIRVVFVVLGLTLLACGSEPPPPKPPEFEQAFSSLPLPPNPEFVSRSGSADALQITIRTPSDLTQVANYYRHTLSQGNWRLVSDMQNPDGSTALYAEHDGPPLWVRIWKAADRPGTMVQLTGAVVGPDSLAGRGKADSTPKPAS